MKDAIKELAQLLGLGAKEAVSIARVGLDAVRKRTRKDLLEVAKKLELKGISGLTKDELARRVHEALQALGIEKTPAEPARPAQPAKPEPKAARPEPPAAQARAPERASAPPAPAAPGFVVKPPAGEAPRKATPEPVEPNAPGQGEDPGARAKLDLGPGAEGEAPAEQIPWSYGVDRVTAAAVDPDKLYVYWEVTDPSIEEARAGLGRGAREAWLNLRVYDTTGLIFDGTNAHSYFDHKLERTDRQWFFQIGKPGSTAFIEIGLKSYEGFFVKIARSGRVDFPRKEPVSPGEPEWMTVLPGTGQVRHAGMGMPPLPPRLEGGAPSGREIPLWVLRESPESYEVSVRELLHGGWERVEWHEVMGEGWFELEGRVEWQGPLSVTTWESGPFAYPVEVEPPTRQEWQGKSFAFKVGGVTHVVYGPWQVVIRNIGAHTERAVLGRWEVYRSWVAQTGRELRVVQGKGVALRAGASEAALGGSERIWLSASELRLGGASEVWRLGASEIRFRGASERLFAGASQWMLRGASERRLGGASEVRLAGASERTLMGASERMRMGASERMGSSERMGASEHRLGASEQRIGGAAAPSGEEPAEGAYPQIVE